MRGVFLLLLAIVLAGGCTRGPVAFNSQEEDTVLLVDRIGARVDTDAERSGNPVVKVDFTGTAVKDEDLIHLKAFTQLETVDLAGTGVTDQGLQHLKEVPSLKRVRVPGTRVTPAGIQKLQQALPAVTVER
jgi:hypothetical protein